VERFCASGGTASHFRKAMRGTPSPRALGDSGDVPLPIGMHAGYMASVPCHICPLLLRAWEYRPPGYGAWHVAQYLPQGGL
jgi:hypothetical protein